MLDSVHARRTLLVAAMAVLAIFLDTTVLFVAYPDIEASFPEVSAAQLSWVLNAYTIAVAALLVPAGKLADRLGHRRAFLTGSIMFTGASVACALAPGAGWLIAFRVAQAVGAAVLVPSSLALVLRATPPARVPVSVAIWGATGAVAGALGPTAGAALVEVGGWRWVFLLNVPVGVFTVLAGRRWLRESADPSTPVPAPVGVVLVAAAAATAALGIVQSDTWGWLDARTIACLIGGASLLAVFVRHQRSSAAPALDLELFAITNYRWANVATVAFGTAFTAMFFGSILFLTEVWGWSVLSAGFGVAPGPALVAVLAPKMGALAARIGQRPLLLGGGVFFALGALWRVVMLDGESDYLLDYLPSMALTGVGVAMSLPQLSSVAAQALPPDRLGVGTATNQAIRQLAGTFGVALTIAFVGEATSLDEALGGFDRVWWLMVLGGLGTTLTSVPLRTAPTPVQAKMGGHATQEPR